MPSLREWQNGKINTIPRDNMENCTEQMSEDTPNTNKDPIDNRIYIE